MTALDFLIYSSVFAIYTEVHTIFLHFSYMFLGPLIVVMIFLNLYFLRSSDIFL